MKIGFVITVVVLGFMMGGSVFNSLATGAVYINDTLIVDGTGFSSPLINDEEFDDCMRMYESLHIKSVGGKPLEENAIEEACVYLQLGEPKNSTLGNLMKSQNDDYQPQT